MLKNTTVFLPHGHELGFDQIKLSEHIQKQKNSPNTSTISPQYQQTETSVTICGEGFRYVYNTLTGLFDSLIKDNRQIIEKPMQYNLWRAPTDNDRRQIAQKWLEWGYDRAAPRAYETTVATENNEIIIKTALSVSANMKERFANITALWRVDGEGRISCRMDVKRNPLTPWLPRFGVRLFLPQAMGNVEYLGLGPHDSYVDKRHACWRGLFKTSVEQMHEDYVRPQENGSRCGRNG